MLPNRCQFVLTSATNGVVKPFMRCDTSFPLNRRGGFTGDIVNYAVNVGNLVDDA